MANEKRLIAIGDVLYIIGKYSFSPSENPQVIEVKVAYRYRKQFHTYPTNEHGSFVLKDGDVGKTVFFNREDAERILRRIYEYERMEHFLSHP